MPDQSKRNPREPMDERIDEEQIRGIVDEDDEFEGDDEDLDDEEDEESTTF